MFFLVLMECESLSLGFVLAVGDWPPSVTVLLDLAVCNFIVCASYMTYNKVEEVFIAVDFFLCYKEMQNNGKLSVTGYMWKQRNALWGSDRMHLFWKEQTVPLPLHLKQQCHRKLAWNLRKQQQKTEAPQCHLIGLLLNGVKAFAICPPKKCMERAIISDCKNVCVEYMKIML